MKFIKLLIHWKETWGNLALLLLPLLYSIDYTKNLITNHIPYDWIISLLVFLGAWIQTSLNFTSKEELKKHKYALENENNMLKSSLESLPEDMIKIFYKHFNLGNEDRITVYRVQDNEWFYNVGRFSENPFFRKGGREKYPIDEGFIGACWANGEYRITNLPNFDKDPERYFNEVVKRVKIDIEVLKNLTMKSRSYYCKRLKFNGEEPIAVVVIESRKRTFSVEMDEFERFLEGPFGKSLVETIKNNLPIGREDRTNG